MCYATQDGVGSIKSIIFLKDCGAKKVEGSQAYPNDRKRCREGTAKPSSDNCGTIGENTDGEKSCVLKASKYQVKRLNKYGCIGSKSGDLVIESPVRKLKGHAHAAGCVRNPSKALWTPSTEQASSSSIFSKPFMLLAVAEEGLLCHYNKSKSKIALCWHLIGAVI